MKKSLLNYAATSLVAFIVVATVVILASDGDKSSSAKEVDVSISSTTTAPTTTTTTTVPANAQAPEILAIPNPCETISIENVEKIVQDATVNGPKIQSALAPSKGCSWRFGDEEFPRIDVSIVSSNTYFDESLEIKVRDIAGLGDIAYVTKGVKTAFGGASCGETIIVEKGATSFSVAICNEKDKKPTDKQLIGLATDVFNSLP